jgi:hypothetical protein
MLVGREEDRELYCHTIHAVESTNAPRVEGLSVAVPFHLDDSRRGVARPACLGRPRADAGPEAAKTAMAPLGWLVGRWSGEGTHTGPEGTREFRQTEHIRPALEARSSSSRARAASPPRAPSREPSSSAPSRSCRRGTRPAQRRRGALRHPSTRA